MQMQTYKVYIQTDTSNSVTAVNSSAFLTDITGWTQIDEGAGDKYHHAQGNYFNKNPLTEKGVYRYNLIDGQVVEKTAEEIAAEEVALPVPQPSQIEILQVKIDTMDGALWDLVLNNM